MMALIKIVKLQLTVSNDSCASLIAAHVCSPLEIGVDANTDTNTDDIHEWHLDNYLATLSHYQ